MLGMELVFLIYEKRLALKRSNAKSHNMCFHENRVCRLSNVQKTGWGGRIRTCACRYQKPVPYHLATPQLCAKIHNEGLSV